MRRARSLEYFRNFVFGVEDSLVSTVGLLSGIAIAGVPRSTIFLTGVVLIFVEAFSMAAGSFLSESSADEYTSGSARLRKSSYVSSAVMFTSYFASGFIPLVPYLLWPLEAALPLSILLSLLALLLLGAISARITRTSIKTNALRMVAIGGIAIAIGAFAGSLLTA